MDCHEFAERIGESGPDDARLEEHAASCPDCRIRLLRASKLAATLRELPGMTLPDDRAAAIRRAVLRREKTPLPSGGAFRTRGKWVRAAAAAVLLVAGLGVAALLGPRDRYVPLELQVIDVHTNGAPDEDLAFEHIYGPNGNATTHAMLATEPR